MLPELRLLLNTSGSAPSALGPPRDMEPLAGRIALHMAKPPVHAAMRWTHDLVFETELAGGRGPDIDGDGASGTSPVQALVLALGGCMATDVVTILTRGRHDLRGLRLQIVGERADGPPSYFTGFTLDFEVVGQVPDAAIQRAVDLSRDKYCSVWHSLRRDIPLDVRFTRLDG